MTYQRDPSDATKPSTAVAPSGEGPYASTAADGFGGAPATAEAATHAAWCRDVQERMVQRAVVDGGDRGPAGPDAAAIASQATQGGGGELPHLGAIQASFGHHDVSGIRAHTDQAAADGAMQLGAAAFASGNDVAFRSAVPDLHTAAHEAAHVVQQRAGVQLKGGLGEAGDAHELHADAVADAVVQGRSAEPLLDAYRGGAAPSAVVQRQVAADDADDDLDVGGDSSYQPTWDEVVAAAKDDPAARAALDIEWIDSLSPFLLTQIDKSFHVSEEHAAFAMVMQKDQQARALRAQHDKDKQALAKARKGSRTTPAMPADQAQAEADRIDRTFEDAYQAREQELRPGFDERKRAFGASKTKVTPPRGGVTWSQGRVLARVNFMAWGMNLLGTPEAVKTHFRSVRKVAGTSALYLAGPAATRLEQTRSWFEQKYPGYQMLQSTIGQAIRGRHQGEHTRGKQGHPLGISADFDATVNVHQEDGTDRFMLREFGGDGAKKGTSHMELPRGSYGTVKEMGKSAAAGMDPSERHLRFLAAADAAFQEMSATSDRFQGSLGERMGALREAQQLYYSQVQTGRARLAKLEAALAKKPDAEQQAEHDALVASVAAAEAQIKSTLDTVFAPWIESLQAQVAEQGAGFSDEELSAPTDLKAVGNALRAVGAVKPRAGVAGLRTVMKKAAYAPLFEDFTDELEAMDFASAQDLVTRHLERRKAARWAGGEVDTRKELIRRFGDMRAVFGTGALVKDRASGEMVWKQERQARFASIMQYLEVGFVRDDDMPDREGARDRKSVFNEQFVEAMMLHGWHPGAAWVAADTMHFDFVEGYDAIVSDAQKFGPTD